MAAADEQMRRCYLVPFLRSKRADVPTLGPRFLVKFARVGKAIERKCPTYARGPPSGLNIERKTVSSRDEINVEGYLGVFDQHL